LKAFLPNLGRLSVNVRNAERLPTAFCLLPTAFTGPNAFVTTFVYETEKCHENFLSALAILFFGRGECRCEYMVNRGNPEVGSSPTRPPQAVAISHQSCRHTDLSTAGWMPEGLHHHETTDTRFRASRGVMPPAAERSRPSSFQPCHPDASGARRMLVELHAFQAAGSGFESRWPRTL